jgi:hypothetical protein
VCGRTYREKIDKKCSAALKVDDFSCCEAIFHSSSLESERKQHLVVAMAQKSEKKIKEK